MKQFLLLLILLSLSFLIKAQTPFCVQPATQYELSSEALKETRQHWVSLPLHYSDTVNYPVIYVLDAEWRFDLIRHLAFDLGANHLIQKAIIVGIPHVEVASKRGIDLTFSQSRIEYDGEAVDSTWYNSRNSGGAQHFYDYLVQELMPFIDSTYSTNQQETLIGHSYGGYFGAYLLSLPHPFEVLHLYDPSIWFSDGEVIRRFEQCKVTAPVKVHITYQPVPIFHKNKIEALITVLEQDSNIELTQQFYPNKTHNALFLDSFYQGIQLTHQ
ncbi:MAG: alpha/beta hydrolase [Aureispira sp.]